MIDKQIDDGGPAFPHAVKAVYPQGHANTECYDGASLRDYFAAAASQGIMANEGPAFAAIRELDAKRTAEDAYAYADAMIAARRKP